MRSLRRSPLPPARSPRLLSKRSGMTFAPSTGKTWQLESHGRGEEEMPRSRKVLVPRRLQLLRLRLARTARSIFVFTAISRVFAQFPPASPTRPWHSSEDQATIRDSQRFQPPAVRIEPGKIYSLAELIDLAEAHNPETRVAWESARAQAESIGIARSEL